MTTRAPDTTTGTTNTWRTRAACNGAPTETFFPHRGNTPTAHTAAEYCAACPVAAACLADAVAAGRTSGIWAGMYFDDGKARRVGEHAPAAQRSSAARSRRAAALQRWEQARADLPSDTAAYRWLAAQYGTTERTARDWIRLARAEATAAAA